MPHEAGSHLAVARAGDVSEAEAVLGAPSYVTVGPVISFSFRFIRAEITHMRAVC